jgi:hypothetical protein
MAAKTEPTERQSAVATATKRQTTAEVLHGSDDKSNKQLDELKGRLDNLLRRGPQRGPVEDLHGSDGKLDEPLRTTRKSLQPISLPSKPVADLHGSRDNEQLEGSVRPSPQRKPEEEEEDEPVEGDDVRPWITSYPDHETSERQANYDLSIANKMTRRSSRGFAGYLVAILIGVAATLAWQSYGDVAKQIIAASAPELGSSPEAKQMIANSIQQLGWTKAGPESTAVQPSMPEAQVATVAQTLPAAVTVAQTLPAAIVPNAPTAPAIDPAQVQQMARDLAALRQTVEQLAAGLDQVTREIGKLEAADVEILAKITPAPPPPRPAPAHKPTPTAPPSSPAPVTPPMSLAPIPPPHP